MGRFLKRLTRILTYSLLVIICLVAIVLLLLRTQWVKRYLLDMGVAKVNGMLNGELVVGDIAGSLFGEIELSDISLVRELDTICTIHRLKLGYQLSPLLDEQIKVDSIIIDSVEFSLRQYADSNWNVAGLMKPDTTSVIDSAADEEPFSYTLLLDNFTLRNTAGSVAALDTTLRLRFEDILLHFSAMYADSASRLSLEELQVQLSDPLLRLERLAFNATRKNDILTVSDLTIETKRNKADATANYVGADTVTASGSMTSDSFDFTEFAAIFPEISVAVTPQIALSGNLVKDSLYGNITLTDSAQVVDLDVTAYPLSYLLSEETRDSVGYSLDGSLANIDISRWIGDSSLAYIINGALVIRGHGLTPEKMQVDVTSNLSECMVLEHRLDTASFDLVFADGKLSGFGTIESNFGSFALDSLSADLLGDESYSIAADLRSLDLAPLFDNDSLRSDLNMRLNLQGKGFGTSTASASLALDLAASRIYDVVIAQSQARINYAPGLINIDTLVLISDLVALNAGGEVSDGERAAIDFRATIDNLSRFHSFAGTDSLGGRIELIGQITGRMDSMVVEGTTNGNDLRYLTTSLQTLTSRFNLALVDSAVLGIVDLRAEQIVASGFLIDSLTGQATLSEDMVASELHFATPDGLAITGKIDLPSDSIVTAVVRSLTIEYLNQHWSGGSPETKVRMFEDAYDIEQFALASQPDSAGNVQRLAVDGRFSMTGSQDLRIGYDKIALAPIAELMATEYAIGGLLSGTLHLTGTANKPELSGRSVLSNGLVQKFTYDSLALEYTYANERFNWTGLLDPGLTGELTTTGFFPLHLSFINSSNVLLPNAPMEIKLSASQLPFAVLGSVAEEMKINGGVINADITLGGTWNQPDMAGALSVAGASFAMEEIGAEYDNLAMALSFNDNRVILDSLMVARGKGFLRATGQLEFENTLMSGVLHSTDFTLVADKIFLARHSNFEIQISGNTNLQGSTAEPNFGGEITIDRSKFYVPFLTEMAAKSSGTLESPPLLMAALYPDTSVSDSTTQSTDSAAVSAMASFDYYRNLRGEMALTIPRNTWLKSPEMNIEISGDIRMVKNSPEDFELFGPITVVRGKYIMYGKEFVIREGTLNFTGGAEYNPDLNLIAQYVFRSPEREKHTLVATITGKAFTPQVAFSLDGSEIPERDALAYVVFGRSMDEVTASGTGGGSGDMAKGVAANVLAGQLASTLGKSLALDVVEIDASSSLAGATITLGKYLTTDLFMSYQRGVGNPSEDEVTPVIVTLEYELTRNLALQLLQGDPKASGFDFVFKFAW